MKNLSNFIFEKILINKDTQVKKDNIDEIRIQNIDELRLATISKAIGTFIKGKEYKRSINIYIIKAKKYIHIFRYCDMHHVSLSIICDDHSDWPNANDWENKIILNGLDDRSNMNNLCNEFYNFIKDYIIL